MANVLVNHITRRVDNKLSPHLNSLSLSVRMLKAEVDVSWCQL